MPDELTEALDADPELAEAFVIAPRPAPMPNPTTATITKKRGLARYAMSRRSQHPAQRIFVVAPQPISVGMASTDAGASTLGELMERADRAMYDHKRNRSGGRLTAPLTALPDSSIGG